MISDAPTLRFRTGALPAALLGAPPFRLSIAVVEGDANRVGRHPV
jgi:hypothetical protein